MDFFTHYSKKMVGKNTFALLYRSQELAIRTLYSEVKDRSIAAGELLRGTPGTLVSRGGTGYDYWYRSFYPVPKKRSEEFVGAAADVEAYEVIKSRMAHAAWTAQQVNALAKLGFQVADKGVGSVLVELHNRHLFESGLAVVGTLGYMGWLNEYGAVAVTARTQDVDLARRHALRLATTVPFLESVRATAAVKLPGAEGLRIDVLAPGPVLGKIVEIPELDWHAQAVPYYDYLLEHQTSAVLLAGGHCIPVKLPEIDRMIWHKIYSSVMRKSDRAKAEKDLLQAATLLAVLIEHDGTSLEESFEAAPRALRSAVLGRKPRLLGLLGGHPQARDAVEQLH